MGALAELAREYTWLIPALPALGAVVLGLAGKRFDKRIVSWIGCGTVGASFVLSVGAFLRLREMGVNPEGLKGWETTLWTWFDVGVLQVPFGFLIDPLSVTMLLFVTGIGFLIHVYSTGYMDGDPGYHRFFAYLNLFMASMLMLVLGSSVLTLFIGWEGVGLCSYLLIGFWWREKENHNPQPAIDNVRSANKAFIVNRVGDFAFLIGIALLLWTTWAHTGAEGEAWTSLSFVEMRANSATYAALEARGLSDSFPILGGTGAGIITLCCLLFFVGATGKSAQIPLYTWLPDAMAGPTPVSALIHAATMVTAGIYMICRLNFLYQLSPIALGTVAVIGGVTAFYAATIGLFQHDIKKVLAYSTVSQLGYMFLGVGTGFFAAGLFHVVTHAFFKALLFLGAGSVIHAMHHVLPHGVDPQDMRHMGGLRRFLPTTSWTFAFAWIAIIGIFPFAGFWSKDEVLWKSFENGILGHQPVYVITWGLGAAGALLTAFYMSRLVFKVFRGKYHGREVAEDHNKTHGHDDAHVHDPHESPSSMTIPLVVLAIGSLTVGLLGLPSWVKHIGVPKSWTHLFSDWLEPSFARVGVDAHGAASHPHVAWTLEAGLGVGIMVAVIIVAIVAHRLFVHRPDVVKRVYEKWRHSLIYQAIYNKYWIDELFGYEVSKARPGLFAWVTMVAAKVTAGPRKDGERGGIDGIVIDGIVHGMATLMAVLRGIVNWFDTYIVDGEDDGERHGFIAWLVRFMAWSATRVRHIQSGDLQRYLRVIAIAAGVGIVIWLGIMGIQEF